MRPTLTGFLEIFGPVAVAFLGFGLFLGWRACRWWHKGGQTVEQIIAGQDVGAEWAGIWRDVRDEMEDG